MDRNPKKRINVPQLYFWLGDVSWEPKAQAINQNHKKTALSYFDPFKKKSVLSLPVRPPYLAQKFHLWQVTTGG